MEKTCTDLTDAARSVKLLRIKAFSAASTMYTEHYIKSRWEVDGYEWELRFYPNRKTTTHDWWVDLDLVLLSKPRTSAVRTTVVCRLVDPKGMIKPSAQIRESKSLTYRNDLISVGLIHRIDLARSSYLKDDALTVECTLTVLKEVEVPAPVKEVRVPSSNLLQHLISLLHSGTGADVTFVVSGDSFPAHKNILAARSPVFMAEFFGEMKERSSGHIKVKEMEGATFKAMLHFIYTDMVPELDEQLETATVMAQHLLVAADRYGLDRLKLICEAKLSDGINVDTAATSLAIAEQHHCPQLKAKCVDFILSIPEILDGVLATEGYKHLQASCPSVLTELLKSSRGLKKLKRG
jgi:speckle-type POZ protein